VMATPNPGMSVTIEAVGFDAPGVARGLTQPGLTYNALNISLADDFVHVGGAVLDAGFVGTSVTVKTGTPLAPFLVLDIAGILAADGAGLALESLGSGGYLYTGL